MTDWVQEEAARQLEKAMNGPSFSHLAFAESCLRAGLREAARQCDAVAATWATFHLVAPGAAQDCAAKIRALAGEEPTKP
ncbi:MAG TPA: hypothetical protein DCP69_10085 [Candidatus Omnitrophica bacterium]|nr:hypothetical protein [Candidatus Omnitrophota bacterium]